MLSRLNQSDPKDPSCEKEDFIRFVTQESTSVGLSPREIEKESADDPELASVDHYVQTGDWSQCSMPGYTCVKNELCIIGKLVLLGDCDTPKFVKGGVRVSDDGHQGVVKTKSRLRTKVWGPKMDGDVE